MMVEVESVELADPTTPNSTAPGLPSLSPSRAADFKTCPLLYRFRTVDRLPEKPSADQLRGTLIHAVLEALFDLPAEERLPGAAAALVGPQWERLLELAPELSEVSAEAGSVDEFLSSTDELLAGYFAVEDPRRLSPAERECLVQVDVEDRLTLRGYVDRLDVSPAGDLRVVDYKSGGAPREAFEARALFQLKFYALVLWRSRGVVPKVLRLLYLKDAEICDFAPDAEDLERFERTVLALWQAIERATAERDFRPKPSRLCGWCSHQALCPAFGGTPPAYPERVEPDPSAVTGDAVPASDPSAATTHS
jgi:putative RecB family exonuclease